MKCSFCNSTNTQAQISKTKRSRQGLILSAIAFCVVQFYYIYQIILNPATIILFLLTGLPIGILVAAIAFPFGLLIPTRTKVIFVCSDCGKITKAAKSKKESR